MEILFSLIYQKNIIVNNTTGCFQQAAGASLGVALSLFPTRLISFAFLVKYIPTAVVLIKPTTLQGKIQWLLVRAPHYRLSHFLLRADYRLPRWKGGKEDRCKEAKEKMRKVGKEKWTKGVNVKRLNGGKEERREGGKEERAQQLLRQRFSLFFLHFLAPHMRNSIE